MKRKSLLDGHRLHPRNFERNAYVYPVLSRRSGGISIGINLNPDKICNMDCIYCQVDRQRPSERSDVDLELLYHELESLAQDTLSGILFRHPRFADVPEHLRRLNDFALSGDGEPTTFKPFHAAVEVIVRVKRNLGLEGVKIVLITDSGCLHQEHVRKGLEIMDQNQGVIWAKLDAGTEAYYRQVNRTNIPFERVVRNLERTAAERPIIIQSLFMNIHEQPPSDEEMSAYIKRIQSIESVGTIGEVHLYTVARRPAESWVTPLEDAALDSLARRVREHICAPVATFYGG